MMKQTGLAGFFKPKAPAVPAAAAGSADGPASELKEHGAENSGKNQPLSAPTKGAQRLLPCARTNGPGSHDLTPAPRPQARSVPASSTTATTTLLLRRP